MITELVIFTLKEDADLIKTFEQAMAPTLASHDAQRMFVGTSVDDPRVAAMLVDWKTSDDHRKFMESR